MSCTDILVLNKWLSLVNGDRMEEQEGGGGGRVCGLPEGRRQSSLSGVVGWVDILVLNKGLGLMKEDRNGGSGRRCEGKYSRGEEA